jgi:hypothetical protein
VHPNGQNGPQDPNFWLDLADRWDDLAARKRKEADGLSDGPEKERLIKQAKRYEARADWCREQADKAEWNAANPQQGGK